MPEELISGGRNNRFCSAACAKAAIADRDGEIIATDDAIRREAQKLVRREKGPRFICEHCGKSFVPMNPGSDTHQYCSNECRSAARRTAPVCQCLNCGKTFRARMQREKLPKFCSPECANAYGRTIRHENVCIMCGKHFTSKFPSKYCSPSCANFANDIRVGTYRKARPTPRVVDYVFKAPLEIALEELRRAAQGDTARRRQAE